MEKSDEDMLLNKKYVYLGASLFSAVILTSLSNQTVKADTTGNGTSTNGSVSTTTDKITPATTKTVSATTSDSTHITVATPTTSGVKPVDVAMIKPKATTISTASSSVGTNTTVNRPSTSTPATNTPMSGSTSTSKVAEPATVPTANKTVTSTSTINLNTGTTTATSSSPTALSKSTTSPNITDIKKSYILPSNASDSTVVNFTDPFLNYMVKSEFGLKSTDSLTIGDVKNFDGSILNLVGDFYYGDMPSTVTSTYVTNFDGMQYLNYLPTGTEIALSVNVSSAQNSNADLTPMNGLNFESLDLFGNYSDPDYKEISLSQLSKLNISDVRELGLHGTGSIAINDGINNQELKMIAPILVEIANKGGAVYLGNSSITDFSPLDGIDKTKPAYLNIINNVYDPSPVYAVDKQPISFTAEHITGLYGTDLSSGYNYSSSGVSREFD